MEIRDKIWDIYFEGRRGETWVLTTWKACPIPWENNCTHKPPELWRYGKYLRGRTALLYVNTKLNHDIERFLFCRLKTVVLVNQGCFKNGLLKLQSLGPLRWMAKCEIILFDVTEETLDQVGEAALRSLKLFFKRMQRETNEWSFKIEPVSFREKYSGWKVILSREEK